MSSEPSSAAPAESAVRNGWMGLAPVALSLTSTAAARAEEATDAAAAVAEAAAPSGAFGAPEVTLLGAPIVLYALFNVYRERLNPEAKFLDFIYILVFLAIVANLFSIAVYKVRWF